jgi:8-oxo-dGTP pyrophosphatase MutT (NUDIX family)
MLRNGSSHENTWAFVGGKVNKNENEYNALLREIEEELGFLPNIVKTIPIEKFTSPKKKFEYHTYVSIVEFEFIPKLNNEHKGYAWTSIDSWPKPLHPGVFSTFKVDEIIQKIKTIELINGQ